MNKPILRIGTTLLMVGAIVASVIGGGLALWGGIGIAVAFDQWEMDILLRATPVLILGAFVIGLAVALWLPVLGEQYCLRLAGLGLAGVLLGGTGLVVCFKVGPSLVLLIPPSFTLAAVGTPLFLASAIKARFAHVRRRRHEEATWPPAPRLVRIARVTGWYCIVAGLASVSVLPAFARLKAEFRLRSQTRLLQRAAFADESRRVDLFPGLSGKEWDDLRAVSVLRDTGAWQIEFCGLPALISLAVSLGAVFEVRRQVGRVSTKVADAWALRAALAFGASVFALLLLGGFWMIGGVKMFL